MYQHISSCIHNISSNMYNETSKFPPIQGRVSTKELICHHAILVFKMTFCPILSGPSLLRLFPSINFKSLR